MRRVLVLDEREATLRPLGEGEENPYYEEPEEHPDPSLGCIRRGLCCKSSPGWFSPGEAEQAAALLGMTPDAFVRAYLIVDGLDLDGERVDVFAPVKLGRDAKPLEPTATRASRLYGYLRGPCVFYQGEQRGCRIYEARPTECRLYVCTNADEDNPSHAAIARQWQDAARQGAARQGA
jgi:Fe-S-cluster containining protein